MRWNIMMMGIGCIVGCAMSSVALAAVDMREPQMPALTAQPTMPAPSRAKQGALQADRPESHPAFDFHPALPSDELHRFPGVPSVIPPYNPEEDQSLRG